MFCKPRKRWYVITGFEVELYVVDIEFAKHHLLIMYFSNEIRNLQDSRRNEKPKRQDLQRFNQYYIESVVGLPDIFRSLKP